MKVYVIYTIARVFVRVCMYLCAVLFVSLFK